MNARGIPPQEEKISPTWNDVYAKVSEALELVFVLQGEDKNNPRAVGIRSHLAKAMILINQREGENDARTR